MRDIRNIQRDAECCVRRRVGTATDGEMCVPAHLAGSRRRSPSRADSTVLAAGDLFTRRTTVFFIFFFCTFVVALYSECFKSLIESGLLENENFSTYDCS